MKKLTPVVIPFVVLCCLVVGETYAADCVPTCPSGVVAQTPTPGSESCTAWCTVCVVVQKGSWPKIKMVTEPRKICTAKVANCATYNLCQGVEVPKPGPSWTESAYCQIWTNSTTVTNTGTCVEGKKVPTAWTPPIGTTTTPCATPPCPEGNSEREVGAGCTTYLQSEVCTNTVQVEEVYNGVTYYTCHPGKKVYTYTCVPAASTPNSMTSTESGGLGATPSNSMELNQSPGLNTNVPHYPTRANPSLHKPQGSPR